MSNGVRVICPDCGDVVSHACHNETRKAARALLAWVPDCGLATEGLTKEFMKAGRKNQWIQKGDTAERRLRRPFFGSQAWSYPLFGDKGTARSFHALIHNLILAAGIDPDSMEQEIRVEHKAREKAEADRQAGIKKRKDERAKVIAFLKSNKNSMEERLARLDEIIKAKAAGLKLIPFYSGDEREDKGFTYLYKFLDTWYGGGINSEMNRARISKLESETYNAQHPNSL
jgi:hypothetical protein